MPFAQKIKERQVPPGRIALAYLGQAGFCLKTSANRILFIDAYFSDVCERLFHFKRMIPSLLQPDELYAHYFLSTHSHADHLDYDILPVVARQPETHFIGSPDCEEHYAANNIANERYTILRHGEQCTKSDLTIKAIFADHGELAPEAVGLLMEISGVKIYHTGDTCFSPEKIKASLDTSIDILIAPINGQYGNMNALEACKLAAFLAPQVVIACHFWMFLQHVGDNGQGDPSAFVRESAALPPSIKAMVMAPGEVFLYPDRTDHE
jgi:L-ascorbate 6-phosphate lactonase